MLARAPASLARAERRTTRRVSGFAGAASLKQRESGARRVRVSSNFKQTGLRCARAPRGLLYNRRKREAFKNRPGGHALERRRSGEVCYLGMALHARMAAPAASATLGFRRDFSALPAFPADARMQDQFRIRDLRLSFCSPKLGFPVSPLSNPSRSNRVS